MIFVAMVFAAVILVALVFAAVVVVVGDRGLGAEVVVDRQARRRPAASEASACSPILRTTLSTVSATPEEAAESVSVSVMVLIEMSEMPAIRPTPVSILRAQLAQSIPSTLK